MSYVELEDVRIYEWEGWCKRNTSNVIGSILGGNGARVFIYEDNIKELETLGLEKLAFDISKECKKGLDVHIIIAQGQYHKDTDSIGVINSYLPIIEKASEKCRTQNNIDTLKKSNKVLCLYYFNTPRWKKSKLWRLLHKRYFKVDNWCSYL